MTPAEARRELLHGLWVVPVFGLIFYLAGVMLP